MLPEAESSPHGKRIKSDKTDPEGHIYTAIAVKTLCSLSRSAGQNQRADGEQRHTTGFRDKLDLHAGDDALEVVGSGAGREDDGIGSSDGHVGVADVLMSFDPRGRIDGRVVVGDFCAVIGGTDLEVEVRVTAVKVKVVISRRQIRDGNNGLERSSGEAVDVLGEHRVGAAGTKSAIAVDDGDADTGGCAAGVFQVGKGTVGFERAVRIIIAIEIPVIADADTGGGKAGFGWGWRTAASDR